MKGDEKKQSKRKKCVKRREKKIKNKKRKKVRRPLAASRGGERECEKSKKENVTFG